MTTLAAKAPAAYENPLIPNARLRQMYLAMLHALMLEKALPARRRARSLGLQPHAVPLAGLEACLVAIAVDLRSSDLVSDAITGGTADFLRGSSLDNVLARSTRRRPITANCGAALRLTGTAETAERLWLALGAAAGHAAVAASAAQSAEEKPKQSAVVIAYVRTGEASPAIWRKFFAAAAAQDLPIVFVSMPPPHSSNAPNAGGLSALATRCRVPGIAVDGKDAVAIYRVAQECIGRARAGGGPALIECIPFLLDPAPPSRQRTPEALQALEHYMLHRSICTQRWLNNETTKFARLLDPVR